MSPALTQSRSDRPAVWLQLLVLVGALAAWMNLGRLHDLQDADSLLPILVSLQHWTLFYWGQDRFGMLVPLLALPFRHPLVNLLVQGWLMTAAALLAPFLVARYFIDEGWFAAGALANVVLLLSVSPKLQFDWLVAQPYALSVSLAFAALLFAVGRGLARTIIAVALILSAHWVNLSVCLIVVPCLAIRPRQRLRFAAIVTAGIAGGFLLKHAAGVPAATTLEVIPWSEWPHGWLTSLRTIGAMLTHPMLLAMLVAAGAVAATAQWTSRANRPALKAAAAAMMAAIFYWLVIGTFRHVQLNEYFARYLLPAALLFLVAIAIVLVASAGPTTTRATIAALAFVAVSLVGYGAPSVKQLRKTLDRNLGRLTPTVIDTRASVIVGNYWTVWPAVFHANLVLYERKGRAPVFGLTYRSTATDPLWVPGSERNRIVLVAPFADGSAAASIASLGIRVRFLGYKTPVAIFVAGE